MAKRVRPGKKLVGAYIDEWLHLALKRRAAKNRTNISVEVIKLLLESQGFLKLDKNGEIIECADSELVDVALKHTEKTGHTDSSQSVTRLLMSSHRLIRQINYIRKSEGEKTFTMSLKLDSD